MQDNNRSLAHLMTSLQVGGAERFVLALAGEQVSRGYDLQLLNLGSEQDTLVDVAREQGIRVQCVDIAQRVKRLHTLHKALQPYAVIHLHSPYALLNLLPLLPLLRNKRLIYTRHGAGEFDSAFWRWVHRFAQPYIHKVSFVSEQGRSVFLRNQRWPEQQLQVIENGVALPGGVNHQPEAHLRLGMVGRMVRLKAFHHLLSALARLDKELKSSLQIHLFGDGPCRADLQQQADSELRDVAVVFHGMQSDQEAIFSAFDLLVVCSETEGLSMAIIEALARGIPVIATNVGGSPRLVMPDETGWLYEYGDIDALTQLIDAVYQQRDVWSQLSDNCVAHIRSHFSIVGCADNYAQLYGF